MQGQADSHDDDVCLFVCFCVCVCVCVCVCDLIRSEAINSRNFKPSMIM